MAQANLQASVIDRPEYFEKAKRLGCGLTAGLLSRSFVAPFERTVIIKQTSMSEYSSNMPMFKMLGSIYRKEGIPGFFRGNAANCLRVAPTTAIEFLMYDVMKEKLSDLTFLNEKLRYVLAGSTAGVMAYAAAYPIDMVKTMHSLGLYRGMSVVATLKALVIEKGPFKVYRGLAATCIVKYCLK